MLGDILYSFLKVLRKERDTIQSASFFLFVFPILLPIGSMYGIFTYIYHQIQPNVGEYTSPMDPMGYNMVMVRKKIFQPTTTPRNGPLFLFAISSATRNGDDSMVGNFGPSVPKPPIASRVGNRFLRAWKAYNINSCFWFP